MNKARIVPANFTLAQNYPNPFNPSTTIMYQIPMNGHVTMKVYDVLGREVRTLVNTIQRAGRYEVKMDGSGLASGVYFYTLTAAGYSATCKMIYMK